jgi:cupin superfamily acireductone dioxygenase involved in methionine salvage
MRLFKDEPKWTPLNRGNDTDNNEHRMEYIKQRQSGFQATPQAV